MNLLIMLVGLPAQSNVGQFSDTLFQQVSHPTFDNIERVNGVALADFDNDFDLDIFLTIRSIEGDSLSAYLLENNDNGTYTDITLESGIDKYHKFTKEKPGESELGGNMSASWGDYDNDGFQDIILTGAFYYKLYHNNQNGTFTEVTQGSGLPSENDCYNTHALWFDFNNDSNLDLYFSKLYDCKVPTLYQGDGAGNFSSVSMNAAISKSGHQSWMTIPWDVNVDGYMDLYIANDFDEPNQVWLNAQGDFSKDYAEEFGLDDRKDGMGLALGDPNNDGLSEVYVTNIDESSFFLNQGNNLFQEVAASVGAQKTGWAWGVSFTDFDHDLDEDLMVVNGYRLGYPNSYFENSYSNTGELKFQRLNSQSAISRISISNGLGVFDFDADGDMDILIGNTPEPMFLFQNTVSELKPERNWIQILLEGTTSNRNAIGSVVEIFMEDQSLIRNYHGSAYLAQSYVPVHFGLKNFEVIDSLKVKWPSGTISTYKGINANQFIKLIEGNPEPLILDLKSGGIKGCMDSNSCTYNSNATIDDGSCTYLESKAIVGDDRSAVLAEDEYDYPFESGSTYIWNVEGGTILEGQGSSKVKVRWGIGKTGRITVSELNTCSSPEVSKNVELYAELSAEDFSVARLWNEVLLEAIRNDYARPTVHARNLFHTSIAIYDSWALFNDEAETYLIGQIRHNYFNDFDGFEPAGDENTQEIIEKAVSYACYRLLSHRFRFSPNYEETQQRFDDLMELLAYDSDFKSTDYSSGSSAALGNFIAQSIIDYGNIDGSREDIFYENIYYEPVNDPLVPALPGNTTISDPHRWQPLQLEVFIDQAGNPVSGTTPDFLSPEWGNVNSFSLSSDEMTTYERDGDTYKVFHDPGSPPMLNQSTAAGTSHDLYKWNFSLVSIWASHLDPSDGVMWDISPSGLGNLDISTFPTQLKDHTGFYNLIDGGDNSNGRNLNPVTNVAYPSQMVPRGDYARVLAEFWADGPDSETPPGHWFVLLNYVSDHPQFVRKFSGQGEVLDQLEWDVKAYFTLGGAMHDAAISAWSIKGWYDYIRPISAIRYMAEKGQSSNAELDNFHEHGIPLIDGYIEVVQENDDLAGENLEHVGKIKLYTWRGHAYIDDTEVDQAGVGWILAENWWPYQRPSFVTPPFAGYVSGHSTYSRAAAEVMTLLTGTKYFPGGVGEFVAKKNEFLVFEEGPSRDIVLQWATYQDASDQCSLSRIWGGIHPPADDIPGRLIGEKIGKKAFEEAVSYFEANVLSTVNENKTIVAPNPVKRGDLISITGSQYSEFQLIDLSGKKIDIPFFYDPETKSTKIATASLWPGVYILRSDDYSSKVIVE
ncbi:MAG: VCBS repeat-containing protein [Cyclobacteriaceae bacterium]